MLSKNLFLVFETALLFIRIPRGPSHVSTCQREVILLLPYSFTYILVCFIAIFLFFVVVSVPSCDTEIQKRIEIAKNTF